MRSDVEAGRGGRRSWGSGVGAGDGDRGEVGIDLHLHLRSFLCPSTCADSVCFPVSARPGPPPPVGGRASLAVFLICESVAREGGARERGGGHKFRDLLLTDSLIRLLCDDGGGYNGAVPIAAMAFPQLYR